MKKINDNQQTNIPPFIAFGYEEKSIDNIEEIQMNETNYYDYKSQKTVYPFFCGSDKKATRSAKNVGSVFFPEYKNHTDDAKEK